VSAAIASAPARSDHHLPTADRGRHRPGQAAYRRLMLGLAAGGFANFALLYYVQPLLPALVARYGVTPSGAAAALSVSTIGMAIALVVVGPASDAIGRVGPMRASLTAAGLLGVASAVAPTWQALLVLRGLAGVALAVLPAVALAYVREEVHPAAHLRANASFITGTAVGGAAGRLLAGPLDARWGWPGATLAVSGLTLLCAVAVCLLLPPSTRFTPAAVRPDALLRDSLRTISDPVVAGICGFGLAGMGVFVGVYNAIAFRLQEPPYRLGGAVALAYVVYLSGVAAPSAVRRVAAAWGRGLALLLAVGLMAAGAAGVALRPLPAVLAGLGLLTFAFLGAHSLASGWVVDRAGRQGLGVAQAASSYLLAYYTGSAVFGVVATRQWQVHGWAGVTALALALTALAAAATAWARRHDPGPAGRPAPR